MTSSRTTRPRCSVFIATSLDGYIARPDGGLDWLTRFESPGEDHGYAEHFARIDTLVVGRKTYDTVLGFPNWPYGDKRCVVWTHRPPPVQHGEQFFEGSAEALLKRLDQLGAKEVYVDGGQAIQQFLAARLIAELTISVIPVVLGDGVRLFCRGGPEQRLELLGSRAWPSGLVQLKYRAVSGA